MKMDLSFRKQILYWIASIHDFYIKSYNIAIDTYYASKYADSYWEELVDNQNLAPKQIYTFFV